MKVKTQDNVGIGVRWELGVGVSVQKLTKSGELRFRGDDFAVFPREQGEVEEVASFQYSVFREEKENKVPRMRSER